MKKLRSSLLLLAMVVLLLPLTYGVKAKAAPTREGIDVSGYTNYYTGSWQDTDWKQVKEAGKEFVFIRCGYTYFDKVNGKYVCNQYKDGYVEKNIQGALDAGLDVGVYYVSQALDENVAKKEADFALKIVKNVLAMNKSYDLTLPIMIDFEDPSSIKTADYPYKKNQPSKDKFNAICKAFCDRVESNGFTAGFYAGKYHVETKFDQDMLCNRYPFWYARYTEKLDKSKVTFWQYQMNARMKGVPGYVDLNRQFINTPGKVNNVKTSINSAGKLCVSWTKIPGVYGYEVRRTSSKTNKEELVATIKGAGKTGYQDQKVENGVTYTYRVRALLKTNKGNYYGPNSDKAAKKYLYYKVYLKENGGKITSGNVTGYAYGTKVNLPTKVEKKYYTFGGWYTNKECTKGRTTAITEKMSGNKTYYAKWTKINLGTPKIKTLKNSGKKQMTVTLQSKIGNADGYYIRYSTNSNMKGAKTYHIKSGSTLSATIKNLQKGKKYYVEVQAYKKDSTGFEVKSKVSEKKNVKISK